MNFLNSKHSPWTFRIARVTNLTLKYIARSPLNENIATPMRFIEVFTTPRAYEDTTTLQNIYNYVVRHDFYAHLRHICDLRIPPLMKESIKPPTPMAEIVFNLIMEPLSLVKEENEFSKNVLLSLTEQFLTERFSEQVDFFIVPCLAAQKNFPYGLWSKILHQNKPKETPWLLYSFLKIGKIHLGTLGPNYQKIIL